MPDKVLTGLMWGLPLLAWVALRTFLAGLWYSLYSNQTVSELERYWLSRTAVASDFLAALLVLGIVLVPYRRRCFDRLAAVVPVLLLAVALTVMLYREGLRLLVRERRGDAEVRIHLGDHIGGDLLVGGAGKRGRGCVKVASGERIS